MATAEVRRHWTAVAALGCLITGGPAQICHCHGPSLRERDPRFLKPKGKKPAWGEWLVVPLSPTLHWQMDHAPEYFARTHGTPAQLLDIVAERTGVDVWQRARECMKPEPMRAA